MRPTLLLATLATVVSACGSSAASHVPPDAQTGRDRPELDLAAGPIDAAIEPEDAAADAGVAPLEDVPVADVGPPGAPVIAAPRTWTWVDVPGSRCADGSPTGFGVNLAPGARDVLVFLQGGGACWDALTCIGPVSSSFYVATGYGRLAFATDVLRPAMLPMRRDDPNNPFRSVNLVYVPYCTGDVHSGDHVARYTLLGVSRDIHHVGYRNLGLFLERITATFPDARRVWLAGDSAGGFGAALNMHRTQMAFPRARVDVLDDSGQPVQPDPARWRAWRAAWGLQVPADCAGCEDDIGRMADYLRVRYPSNRFGLISYTHDSVISTFMGLVPTAFNRALTDFAARMEREWPSGKYFFIPGLLHVGLLTPSPALIRWIEQFMSDDPAWESHRP